MVYWLKLRVILTKENDLNVFIKELFMKKIITAVAMVSLLSGCQLIEQLQGSKQKLQPYQQQAQKLNYLLHKRKA